MLEISGSPNVYLSHAHHFFGFLMGGLDKRMASRGFNALMQSEVGTRIITGGDLCTAIQNGPLSGMMYMHRVGNRGGGGASPFLTIKGMLEMMNGLPSVDGAIRRKLDDLLAGHLAGLSFAQATHEQCMEDEANEVLDQIFTEGSRGGNEPDGGLQLVTYRYVADNRALIDIAKSKDDVIKAKDAEIAALKVLASKDAEIMELRMQLLRAERSPRSDPEGASPAKKASKPQPLKVVFLIAYEGEQGLVIDDFQPFVGVKTCDSMQVDGLWVTVFSLASKRQQHSVEDILRRMRSRKVFKKKVFVENPDGEKRLDVFDLDNVAHVSNKIKRRIMQDAVIEDNDMILHLAELS